MTLSEWEPGLRAKKHSLLTFGWARLLIQNSKNQKKKHYVSKLFLKQFLLQVKLVCGVGTCYFKQIIIIGLYLVKFMLHWMTENQRHSLSQNFLSKYTTLYRLWMIFSNCVKDFNHGLFTQISLQSNKMNYLCHLPNISKFTAWNLCGKIGHMKFIKRFGKYRKY